VTSYLPPICRWCTQRNPVESGRSTCNAFPGGIPDEILFSKHDHRFPFPGDNGIVFTPDPAGGEPIWPIYFPAPDGEAVVAGLFSRIPRKGLHYLNWNPDLHPRGRDGQFIETNGYAAFDWFDHRTKRTKRLTGRVTDVIPDARHPGNPTIKVEVFDQRFGHVTYSLKPHQIDTIDVKADLSGWSNPLTRLMGDDERQISTLRDPSMLSLSTAEQKAALATPAVKFLDGLDKHEAKQVEDTIDEVQERWPHAPLTDSVDMARRMPVFNPGISKLLNFGRRTDSTISVNSDFHNDGFPDGMYDPSPRGRVLHEYGHILDDALREDDRDLAIELESLIESQEAGSEASALGKTNSYEFVAESVVDVMENGDNAKPASKQVAAILDRAFGKGGIDSPANNNLTRQRMSRNEKDTRAAVLEHEARALGDLDLARREAEMPQLEEDEQQALIAERQRRTDRERDRLRPVVPAMPQAELERLAMDDDATQVLREAAGAELGRRAADAQYAMQARAAYLQKINAQIEELDPTNVQRRYEQLERTIPRGSPIDTDRTYDHRSPPEDEAHKYSPERAALHEEMWNELLEQVEKAQIPRDRDALALGGLPGSGKTYSLKPGQKAAEYGVTSWEYGGDEGFPPIGTTHVSINPDGIKEMMVEKGMGPPGLSPKLGGLEGASFIHEESSYISKMFSRRLSALGYNMVLDNTMNTPESMKKKMLPLANEGYTFRGLFADIPVPESKISIKDRYMDAPIGKGRFVPSAVVGGRESPDPNSLSLNRDAFDKLVDEDWFTSWKVIDNTGISERPRNPRGVVTAQGTGEGSKPGEIYAERHPEHEDVEAKAARLKAEEDEAKREREERKRWWKRLYEKFSPPDEPFDLPDMHPGMVHPEGPEPGFPGGQLPPGVEAPVSVSQAPSGFI
jgi:hypothetical protein